MSKHRFSPRRVVQFGLFALFVAGVGLLITTRGQDFAAIAYPPPPPEYIGYAFEAAKHCGLPDKAVNYMLGAAYAESGFNPNARSHAGALGMYQLLAGTGYGIAVQRGISGLNAQTFFDPRISSFLGGCYMDYVMDKVGSGNGEEDWSKPELVKAVFVGYNAGPANGAAYLRGSYRAPGPVGYAEKVYRAGQVYSYDINRYLQQQGTDVLAPLQTLRTIVWTYFLNTDAEE